MPIQFKGTLRRVMPEAGMKYQSSQRLMHHIRRDKRVGDALQATGYEITRQGITQILINMFQTATPIVAEGHANGEDLWDVLPRVQRQIDWAHNIPDAIFFELFVCLVEARHEWEKKPQYPHYEYHLYNPAVRELVAFRTAIGDCGANHVSWVLTDAVFFNELARGLDIDGDEDEDIAMGDTNPDNDECQKENEDPMVTDVVQPLAQMKIEQDEEL